MLVAQALCHLLTARVIDSDVGITHFATAALLEL